jgi:hypothetical protein
MRRTSPFSILSTLVFASGLSACAIADGAESEPAAVRQPVLGDDPQFPGCGDREDDVRAALAIVQARVTTDAYAQCIEDSLFVDHDYRMVEEIVAASRTPDDVTIRCVEDACGDAGCASAGPERIELVNDHIAEALPAELAATITHEIMHTKGWMHPSQMGEAVSDVAAECLRDDRSAGFALSESSGTRCS